MSFQAKAILAKPGMSRKSLAVAALCAQAQALHRQGQLAEARIAYTNIIKKSPTHFEALYMTGVCERQSGNYEAAIRLFRRTLLIDPRSAEVHAELGLALFELKRHDEALACFDRVIELNPVFPELHYKRGNALLASKRYNEAILSFERMISIDPNHVSAWNNRGNALLRMAKPYQAMNSYDKALSLKPTHVSTLINRGTALLQLRQAEPALVDLNRALSLAPDQAVAWATRAESLRVLRRFQEAVESCDKALSIDPELAATWLVRAHILTDVGLDAEAMAACRRALEINPKFPSALIKFSLFLSERADLEAAISCLDQALEVEPDDETAISTRIFFLDFMADRDFAAHQEARSLWWNRIGTKIAAERPSHHNNEFDPNKRLVLGYVSADFKRHSAAFTYRLVLQNCDRSQFEVICYSGSHVEDEVTASFREAADQWRDARLWSDDQLAQCIRNDRVDILIDLSGHSEGNRLAVFARKAAPIQVTAWGHATGTGLPTMDYLFSDPVMVPQEVRHLYAEQIYDLPCAITIERPVAERRSEPPVISNGYVTYGVFNRVSKISDAAIALWARILQSDLTARLMIKDVGIDIDSVRDTLLRKFAAHGVIESRLQLVGSTNREEHLAAYGEVDICLDPFPHGGGVSSWEALHMGVPIVSKIGNALPKRIAGAIMSAVGLADWVAGDDDEYVDIALRSTPERLAAIRRELPERIAARCGPLAYARAVEQGYRAMWKKLCSERG